MAKIELHTLEPELTVNKFGIDDSKSYTLSDQMTGICQWINFTFLCQVIAIFGIGTNIINIICFVKQGFNDPVNISLLGLAVADMGCLVTLIWANILFTPAFADLDLPFDTLELQYLTSGMTHITFTRITGWITATITIERCLCIAAPLKVRNIVTSKRVLILNTFIFVILLSSVTPFYIVNKLDIKYFPKRNKTLLGLVPTSNREQVETISFVINNVFVPFGSFFVVIVCTITLVVKLQERTKWRSTSTSVVQADTISSRNRKIAKMIVTISTLFIACFIPTCIVFITMVIEPEFSIYGKYRNPGIVIIGICFVLESINSSSNIFIYYKMSSKYRFIFRETFHLSTDQKSSDFVS